MGIKERSGTKSSSARKNNQQVIEKDTLLFSNDRSDDGNVCHSETTVFTSQNSNTTSGTTLKSHIKHSDPSSLPHTNSKKKLWAAEEVPMFLRQRYISYGYRGELRDAYAVIRSLFEIHNETLNIWTHLFAFFIMVLLSVTTLLDAVNTATFDQMIAFSSFFACAGICFLLSSIYHLFSCHSFEVYRKVMTCDYLGIFAMVLGSFLSGLHFSFHCFPSVRLLYQIGIFVPCSVGAILALNPTFDSPKYRFHRIACYVSTVSFAVFPLVHGALLFGVSETVHWWILLSFYGIGLGFYVSKFPESHFPGKFDILCSSHQLWHTMTAIAALWHYFTLTYLYRRISTCSQFYY